MVSMVVPVGMAVTVVRAVPVVWVARVPVAVLLVLMVVWGLPAMVVLVVRAVPVVMGMTRRLRGMPCRVIVAVMRAPVVPAVLAVISGSSVGTRAKAVTAVPVGTPGPRAMGRSVLPVRMGLTVGRGRRVWVPGTGLLVGPVVTAATVETAGPGGHQAEPAARVVEAAGRGRGPLELPAPTANLADHRHPNGSHAAPRPPA